MKTFVNAPELKVKRCTLHRNSDIDLQVDKLSSSLEVRLRHQGCSKEHCHNPKRNENILGKILELKESSKDRYVYENFPLGTSTRSWGASWRRALSLTDSISFTSCSTYLTDLGQDAADLEQIRRAREMLIRQRYDILNDPEKMRTVDFIKMRHCLRQYHLMSNKTIDYYSDNICG